MLTQPVWYKDFEGWLLRYGLWVHGAMMADPPIAPVF